MSHSLTLFSYTIIHSFHTNSKNGFTLTLKKKKMMKYPTFSLFTKLWAERIAPYLCPWFSWRWTQHTRLSKLPAFYLKLLKFSSPLHFSDHLLFSVCCFIFSNIQQERLSIWWVKVFDILALLFVRSWSRTSLTSFEMINASAAI